MSVGPAIRTVTGKKPGKNAVSADTIRRFETEMLTGEENLGVLDHLNGDWVDKAMEKTPDK